MRLPRKSIHSKKRKGSEKTKSLTKTIQSISTFYLKRTQTITKNEIPRI